MRNSTRKMVIGDGSQNKKLKSNRIGDSGSAIRNFIFSSCFCVWLNGLFNYYFSFELRVCNSMKPIPSNNMKNEFSSIRSNWIFSLQKRRMVEKQEGEKGKFRHRLWYDVKTDVKSHFFCFFTISTQRIQHIAWLKMENKRPERRIK